MVNPPLTAVTYLYKKKFIKPHFKLNVSQFILISLERDYSESRRNNVHLLVVQSIERRNA